MSKAIVAKTSPGHNKTTAVLHCWNNTIIRCPFSLSVRNRSFNISDQSVLYTPFETFVVSEIF